LEPCPTETLKLRRVKGYVKKKKKKLLAVFVVYKMEDYFDLSYSIEV